MKLRSWRPITLLTTDNKILTKALANQLKFGKVNRLQEKVKHFESFSKDAALSLKVLDEGMSFVNSEIESMKENIKLWEEKTARVERKLQGEIETLRDEKLYMEVYQ